MECQALFSWKKKETYFKMFSTQDDLMLSDISTFQGNLHQNSMYVLFTACSNGRNYCLVLRRKRFVKEKMIPTLRTSLTTQDRRISLIKIERADSIKVVLGVPVVSSVNLILLTQLTLVLLNPDIHCFCKQCKSRSVGF